MADDLGPILPLPGEDANAGEGTATSSWETGIPLPETGGHDEPTRSNAPADADRNTDPAADAGPLRGIGTTRDTREGGPALDVPAGMAC